MDSGSSSPVPDIECNALKCRPVENRSHANQPSKYYIIQHQLSLFHHKMPIMIILILSYNQQPIAEIANVSSECVIAMHRQLMVHFLSGCSFLKVVHGLVPVPRQSLNHLRCLVGLICEYMVIWRFSRMFKPTSLSS